MFATLATNLKDPVERLRAVHRGTRSAKAAYSAGIEDAVMKWAHTEQAATARKACRGDPAYR